MKTKMLFLIVLCLGQMACIASAQEVFVPYGHITYEKKVKKLRSSEWLLSFNERQSLYKAIETEPENSAPLFFLQTGTSKNALYTNYGKGTRLIRRNIMGEEYLLKDTIPQISWKILHELREIAGYQCRKALGRINDTVYVVAFYAEEILLNGGPEGFNGLPGMILGLAIPRYGTTWFATRVEGFSNPAAELSAAMQGKPADTEKEVEKLIEVLSRYESRPKEKQEALKQQLYGFLL